jgi:hypothetical protein
MDQVDIPKGVRGCIRRMEDASAERGKNAKLDQGGCSIFRSGYRSSTCIRRILLSFGLM